MIIKCENCGRSFERGRKVMYCSKRCKDIASRRRRGISTYGLTEPIKKVCPICGEIFETLREDIKTCGREDCVKANRRNRARERSRERSRELGVMSLEEYREKQKRIAEQNRLTKQIEKAWEKALHTEERECVVCGNVFYCLDRENNRTCSNKCSRRYYNIKRDNRVPKAQRVDTISLERLYRRDGGKCYLCGCDCDYNDWKISPRGNKYPGDKYPEVEHVLPISRGGLHAWDNVRLACHKCNHDKGDGLISIDPITKEYAYSEAYMGSAKKTAQYTLDGVLVKVWDSTAEIKRALGLNDKHIQNVCRGDKSRTGNAFGYHWEYV